MLVAIKIENLDHYYRIYDHFGNKDYCCVENIIYDYEWNQYVILIDFYQTHGISNYLKEFKYQFFDDISHLCTPFGINEANAEIISEREYIRHAVH